MQSKPDWVPLILGRRVDRTGHNHLSSPQCSLLRRARFKQRHLRQLRAARSTQPGHQPNRYSQLPRRDETRAPSEPCEPAPPLPERHRRSNNEARGDLEARRGQWFKQSHNCHLSSSRLRSTVRQRGMGRGPVSSGVAVGLGISATAKATQTLRELRLWPNRGRTAYCSWQSGFDLKPLQPIPKRRFHPDGGVTAQGRC